MAQEPGIKASEGLWLCEAACSMLVWASGVGQPCALGLSGRGFPVSIAREVLIGSEAESLQGLQQEARVFRGDGCMLQTKLLPDCCDP